MPILTTEVQLEQVQTAITNLLLVDWQRMDVDQREVERHRLDWLTAREKILLQRYQEEQANDGQAFSPIRVRGMEPDL
jgi:hypothetical protein